MLLERTFHLKGADAIASTDNHIVGASHKPEVAILVLVGAVSCDIPVAANAGLGGFGVMPVFAKHPGRTLRLDLNRDIAFFVGWQFAAVEINDTDLEAG